MGAEEFNDHELERGFLKHHPYRPIVMEETQARELTFGDDYIPLLFPEEDWTFQRETSSTKPSSSFFHVDTTRESMVLLHGKRSERRGLFLGPRCPLNL